MSTIASHSPLIIETC